MTLQDMTNSNHKTKYNIILYFEKKIEIKNTLNFML